jgi:hypothetical protein
VELENGSHLDAMDTEIKQDFDVAKSRDELHAREVVFKSKFIKASADACNDNEKNLEVLGWTLVPQWNQCPIGTLPSSDEVPNLDLAPQFDNLGWLEEQNWLKIPFSDGSQLSNQVQTQSNLEEPNEFEIQLL